jgi:hypothetical protein
MNTALWMTFSDLLLKTFQDFVTKQQKYENWIEECRWFSVELYQEFKTCNRRAAKYFQNLFTTITSTKIWESRILLYEWLFQTYFSKLSKTLSLSNFWCYFPNLSLFTSSAVMATTVVYDRSKNPLRQQYADNYSTIFGV